MFPWKITTLGFLIDFLEYASAANAPRSRSNHIIFVPGRNQWFRLNACVYFYDCRDAWERKVSSKAPRSAHSYTLLLLLLARSRLFPVAIISIMGNKMENLWAHACKNRVFAWAKFTFLVRRSLLPCAHFANLPRPELNFNISRCRCFNFYTPGIYGQRLSATPLVYDPQAVHLCAQLCVKISSRRLAVANSLQCELVHT
jgi:hypothetical protein